MSGTTFRVVNVDTDQIIFESRSNSPESAFTIGDQYIQDNPTEDYRVVNTKGNPIPRSELYFYQF